MEPFNFLILSSLLFSVGFLGIFINRKNLITILMSIELMLLSANINLDEISLGNKLSTAIDDQVNSITDEAEAGIIAGKSSLVVTNELNNLSNRQIRDFYFKPETQLDYVNGLVEKQKSKIYDLSFNSVPESTIYDNQIVNLQEDSIDSFLDTESSLDFSFNENNIENDITFNTESIKKQQFQISTIEEGKNPLARKIQELDI